VRLQPVTVEQCEVVVDEDEEIVVVGHRTLVLQSVTVCVEQVLIKLVESRSFSNPQVI
jgi:hypothetical protein